GVSGRADQQLPGEVFTAEEPLGILRFEARQAPVGRGGAGGPAARYPAGPGERAAPLAQPRRVGFAAGGEDPGQRLRLGRRRQVAAGEIVAGRAGRNPGRLCNLPDAQPGALPAASEFAAEVLLGGDAPGVGLLVPIRRTADAVARVFVKVARVFVKVARVFVKIVRVISHWSPWHGSFRKSPPATPFPPRLRGAPAGPCLDDSRMSPCVH